ncbi:MAG: outer membrane beta-barrel protein [Proteobacteria bacterium]|nr:outer membrane beta-barrel protein [Pseudomonadota bacterium]
MKTKVLLSLSAAALVNAAQLSAAPQISSGAYAGVAAGISVLGGKNKLTTSNDAGGGAQILQDQGNFSLSKASAAAILFGGYGAKINEFWLGGEVFYQFDSLKDKQNPAFAGAQPVTLKSASTDAYGASLHLGFLPAENCVAYAILGVEMRKFKVQFSDPTPAGYMSTSINKKYNSLAFVPGVGMRFALVKNLSFRTEYKFAMHRGKKVGASGENARNPGQLDVVTIKHQPKVHSFNIGVVYNF